MAQHPTHPGIVILGTPRSGTTLLRRLLTAHPHIACPGETNLLSACARFLASERTAEGIEIGVLPGLAFAGFPRQDVLQRLRRFAFSFHEELAQRLHKPRWAEKTAFDSFHVEAIELLCGDHAYFICMIRHALDFVCSMRELCDRNGGYLHEVHEYIRRFPRPLEAFAHIWVDLTTAIQSFAARHPANAILLRYEDLVAQPDQQMRRILELIGEDGDTSFLSDALSDSRGVGLGDWKTYTRSRVDAASVSRWKALPPDTLDLLAPIVNPLLVQCGFDVVAHASRAWTPEERQRRYELGLLLHSARVTGREQPTGE